MTRTEHFAFLAQYNQWMNAKVYAAASQLTPAELHLDRRAFFGSIFGTLNHVAVGDTLWLRRFAQHPACFPSLRQAAQLLEDPAGLQVTLFPDLAPLTAYRETLDRLINAFTAELAEADLDTDLAFRSTNGVDHRKDFHGVLMHFFNHQTHHRGQASTLLTQAGVDVGVTDLLVLLQNVQ